MCPSGASWRGRAPGGFVPQEDLGDAPPSAPETLERAWDLLAAIHDARGDVAQAKPVYAQRSRLGALTAPAENEPRWPAPSPCLRSAGPDAPRAPTRAVAYPLVPGELPIRGRALPVPVKGGSRYGIYHCCCNYPTLTPATKEAERKKWDNIRKSFRKDWSERFGQWPQEKGKAFPGHHVRDLQHGGDPVDPNNIIPAQPDVHEVFNDQYPACYEGKAPWNTVGPNLPYTDN